MTTETDLPELVGTLANLPLHTQETIRAYGAACARTALQSPEVLRLREDAERYRMLRRGQCWSVIDGIGCELRADTLDARIDAAMEKQL